MQHQRTATRLLSGELNGKAGLITGYDDERQRFIVRFEKFGEKALKGDNLRRASVSHSSSALESYGMSYRIFGR